MNKKINLGTFKLVTGIIHPRVVRNFTQTCGLTKEISSSTDFDVFQKNKMAARIQNGRRLAKNANFCDILASKLC